MLRKPLMGFALLALASQAVSTTSAAADKNTSSTMQQAPTNKFWWPERLDLSILRQHATESNPMDKNFDYRKEFKKLNLVEVKKDIAQVLT
ncbi:MAG: hypothetical protein AAGB31_14785, partial [Bdellovibrio sp.]